MMNEVETKRAVREGYARVARQDSGCGCGCGSGSISPCCGGGVAKEISKSIGYSDEEMAAVPEGANLGLGCGNPTALASLQEGETVLDLGSGAGFDCFLAASRVGEKGRVIGVDMTPEMIEKARQNCANGSYENVEFRLGEIENLPAADKSVDVVISNCVINLSTDKGRVFREAFRVLRPGGRMMISDIVLLKELPDPVKASIEAYVGCVSGALLKDEYLKAVKAAGFRKVDVVDEASFPIDDVANDPTAQAIIQELGMSSEMLRGLASSVMSVKVAAVRPGRRVKKA